MQDLIDCLDLSYHEMRYVYKDRAELAPKVIESNLPDNLKRIYNIDPKFYNKLNSVLKYTLRYGKSVMAYAEGRKKIYRMPKIENRKLNHTDLELLVGLNSAANLGPSLVENEI